MPKMLRLDEDELKVLLRAVDHTISTIPLPGPELVLARRLREKIAKKLSEVKSA